VVVAGPFSGTLSGHDVIKLSGSDGSVQWTSDAFSGGGASNFFVASDGNLIAIGANGWAKLDAATGGTIWMNAFSPTPCLYGCAGGYDILGLPDGGVLEVGQREYQASVDVLPGVQGGVQQVWRLPSA